MYIAYIFYSCQILLARTCDQPHLRRCSVQTTCTNLSLII